jgi:hypothetical protein
MRGARPETDLHAWYSDTPFGDWTPHPLNPIKSDTASARPAGKVIRTSTGLYRPAQDCSAGYGGAIVINRIVRLDPEGFQEEVVKHLAPDPAWPFPHGLHTINTSGGRTVIDAKRMVFDVFGPFWILVPHIRRLLTIRR